MSDFHLDAFIDDLAESLLQARCHAVRRVLARCRDRDAHSALLAVVQPLVGQAMEQSFLPAELIPAQGIGGMDMELTLSCQLEHAGIPAAGQPGLALRVCTANQGHALSLGFAGSDPLFVSVRLDGCLLRSFAWHGRRVCNEVSHG